MDFYPNGFLPNGFCLTDFRLTDFYPNRFLPNGFSKSNDLQIFQLYTKSSCTRFLLR